jgi:hypothetical protein
MLNHNTLFTVMHNHWKRNRMIPKSTVNLPPYGNWLCTDVNKMTLDGDFIILETDEMIHKLDYKEVK